MRNIIESSKPGEKLATNDELTDLLNSALNFARSGELNTEGESHAAVRTIYSTEEGRIYTVIIFSNDGVLDAASVLEILPGRHHSKAGEHVVADQFRQINMTFDLEIETWRFGINDLGGWNPQGISQAVARKMTQLLRSETQPTSIQHLSISAPK